MLDSPLGKLLIAATEKGLCAITIGDSQESVEASLREEFPKAQLMYSPSTFVEWTGLLQNYFAGERRDLNLPIDVQATAFQQQVWTQLKKIPYGQTRTYKQIAEAIGKPHAARAVGRACASNKVAIVVPCHRVVPENGSLGGYRWGVDRKQKLLQQEQR